MLALTDKRAPQIQEFLFKACFLLFTGGKKEKLKDLTIVEFTARRFEHRV